MTKELGVDPEFVSIAKEVIAEGRTAAQWAEVEADDWVQTTSYCGGFDAIEMAFTFSWYDGERTEWWFQLTLDELGKIAAGERYTAQLRRAKD